MGRATSPRVAEVVEEYLVVRQGMGKAEGTVAQDRYVLRNFARKIAKGTNPCMCNVTVQQVQMYLYGPGGVMDSGIEPGTHNNMLRKIRGLFEFARSRGYCEAQLITGYNGFNRLKPVQRERYRPSPQVLAEMLDSAEDPVHRAYLAVAINTLGRTSELTSLKIGHLDLENGWITYKVHKTHQEDRFPITSDLHDELRRWLAIYERAIDRPLNDEDYLLPARVAGRVGRMVEFRSRKIPRFEYEYRPDQPLTHAHRIVQKALKAVGRDLVKGEGTHTIRRGMARALFDRLAEQKGYEGALETVSAALHHSSVTMTERYLGIEARRMKRDAIMRGQPLLSDMVREAEVAEVVRLQA